MAQRNLGHCAAQRRGGLGRRHALQPSLERRDLGVKTLRAWVGCEQRGCRRAFVLWKTGEVCAVQVEQLFEAIEREHLRCVCHVASPVSRSCAAASSLRRLRRPRASKRFHGLDAAFEHLGGLVLAHPFVVHEHDRRALALGQLRERGLHLRGQLSCASSPLGRSPVAASSTASASA